MSSGTCNTMVDDEKCVRHQGHPGDHFGEAAVLPAKAPAALCGAKQSKHSLDSCKSEKGHEGRHSDPEQGVSWPQEKAPEELCQTPNAGSVLLCTQRRGHVGGHQTRDGDGVLHTWHGTPPVSSIPDSVRTRVRLHAAQTEYDLTVLKNRIDCMPTVTQLSKELRLKREQLTAELEAWQYLSKITHTRMD